MPDFAMTGDGQDNYPLSLSGGSPLGVSLSTSVVHTKGSWVEISSATPWNCSALLLHLHGFTSVTGSLAGIIVRTLYDLGIGPLGQEEVLVPDVFCCQRAEVAQSLAASGNQHCLSLYLPIEVSKGSRLSLRSQTSHVPATTRASVTLLGSGFVPSAPLADVSVYGIFPSSTSIGSWTPGSTGAWSGQTTMGGATSHKAEYLILGAFLTASANFPASDATRCYLIELTSTSGEVLASWPCSFDEKGLGCYSPPLPVSIPAVSSLQVRVSCSSAEASPPSLGVVGYLIG